jgi:hypothetical protein
MKIILVSYLQIVSRHVSNLLLFLETEGERIVAMIDGVIVEWC